MSARTARVAVTAVMMSALLGVVATPLAGADVSPATQATTEKGERLVNKFFGLFGEPTDTSGLEKFLSSAFILQRANGTSADKATYLEDPASVEAFEISDLQATRTGGVLVARYTVVVDSTVDGQHQATDPAPRLSVFVKGKQGWQIVAHSNFNTLLSEQPDAG